MLAAVLAFSALLAVPVMAETLQSPNYEATELQFGSGSTEESCSGEYCATASIGDLSAGDAQAGESTAQFGSITSDDPLLEVIIDPGESNLGVLTTEQTASKTMKVRIRTYLVDGYTLQISGTPPSYSGHALATPSTPTASSPGTEQFGINVVDNTTPDIGANPTVLPADLQSTSMIEDDYNTPDLFKYQDGEVIVRNPIGEGQTNYEVSFIVNISSSTPAGHFVGDFSAVVVPLF